MQLAHQVQWVASVGALDVQNGYVSKMQTWITAYVLVPVAYKCCAQTRATCQTVQCCAVQRATCQTLECCAVQRAVQGCILC